MTTKTMTLIFIAIVVVAIAIYDTVVAINRVGGDTISEIALVWASAHPIAGVMLGVALGIVLGHLFWPQVLPPK